VDERGRQHLGALEVDAETVGQLGQSRDGEWDDLASEPGEDVVDRVAHGLDVLEVFVLDPEADAALPELLFEGFGQLDEGERVGVEVIGERVALLDGGGFDLEDVGQAVADEVEHLLTVHGTALDVGLGGHAGYSWF
jgi:hypothetical protein